MFKPAHMKMTARQYANKFGIPNGSQERSLYRFAEEYADYIIKQQGAGFTLDDMRKCFEAGHMAHVDFGTHTTYEQDYNSAFNDYLKLLSPRQANEERNEFAMGFANWIRYEVKNELNFSVVQLLDDYLKIQSEKK